MTGSGFRVQGSGFRVQGSGFRVQGSGFRVQGSGFRVQVRRWIRSWGIVNVEYSSPIDQGMVQLYPDPDISHTYYSGH